MGHQFAASVEGRWGHRSLGIFHGEDLRAGTAIAHPMNTERRFADSPYSYGRGAGPLHITRDGRVFRPMQASPYFYGEALRWTRIDVRSEARFIEPLCETTPPEVGRLPDRPLHHAAGHGAWLACDSRDRRP